MNKLIDILKEKKYDTDKWTDHYYVQDLYEPLFEQYQNKKVNVLDAMYQDDDFTLQVEAQRKFFATALNYSVSMILQGGTGGKTISDTDYEIMEKSMYNGLFTSKGLNLSALEAIYKTVRLPSIVAQYKTNLDSANAIQNMQAAVKYEKLINYG